MSDQVNHRIRELGATRLQLRSDLTFTPQLAGGQSYYLVEDPLNSRFLRLGQAEYTFIAQLDGGATIRQAWEQLATVMPHHRLTEADAAGLCRWLVEMDLAQTDESSQAAKLASNAQTKERRQALARFNPLVFRWPLGRPDAIFARLAGWLGWLFTPWAAVCWLGVFSAASYQVAVNWSRFVDSSQGVFAAGNWLWLLVCWAVLKIVHEAAHGIVCKRYGGTVRETGLLFVLLAPLAYVDVTSSWRFRSAMQRIHVAAAGMYLEFLLASVAAMTWSCTPSGWLNHLCFNIVVMASLSTLAFNANPLMRFDGYYILSDALAMPNLAVNGQAYLKYWSRRYLLGVSATLPNWTRAEKILISVYGWASFFWRIFVCLSLTLTAATLFQGAGLVLAGMAVVLWFGIPALEFAKYMCFGKTGEQPQRVRFCAALGATLIAAALVLGLAPWPGGRTAPAVVEYAPQVLVRATSAGFVKQVFVTGGELVKPGQLLALLENRKLVRELADLKLQIRQAEIRSWQYEQQGQRAAQQAETKKREALLCQHAELESQVAQLTVLAPCSGQIIGRNLPSLVGTYLQAGDEILAVGDEARKELRLSIKQDDLDVFAAAVGKRVRIDAPRLATMHSELATVIPRASLTPHHPALMASNGGPLAVEPNDDAGAEDYELLAPRFIGTVRLNHQHSRHLRTGQRVQVTYRPYSQSWGEHLHQAAARWLRGRLAL